MSEHKWQSNASYATTDPGIFIERTGKDDKRLLYGEVFFIEIADSQCLRGESLLRVFGASKMVQGQPLVVELTAPRSKSSTSQLFLIMLPSS